MGNYISNNSTWLHAKRILMRYNIENRTMKELDRQANKPKVAPKHDAGLINYHESLSSKFNSFQCTFMLFCIPPLHQWYLFTQQEK